MFQLLAFRQSECHKKHQSGYSVLFTVRLFLFRVLFAICDVSHCSDCPCGLDWFCSFDTQLKPSLFQNLRLNFVNMVP